MFPFSSAVASELKALSFELSSFHNKRDPFLPEYDILSRLPGDPNTETWSYLIALQAKYDAITTPSGSLYWNQDIVGLSTDNQFRRVHWEFEWGIRMKYVSIFHHHKSEHALDIEVTKYPLEDRYGIRINLMGDK
jgi:hypothetical protein